MIIQSVRCVFSKRSRSAFLFVIEETRSLIAREKIVDIILGIHSVEITNSQIVLVTELRRSWLVCGSWRTRRIYYAWAKGEGDAAIMVIPSDGSRGEVRPRVPPPEIFMHRVFHSSTRSLTVMQNKKRHMSFAVYPPYFPLRKRILCLSSHFEISGESIWSVL